VAERERDHAFRGRAKAAPLGGVAQCPEIGGEACGVLRVEERHGLARQGVAHHRVAPAAGAHAQQLELRGRVGAAGGHGAPPALVGGKGLPGHRVDERDAKGAEADRHLAPGHRGPHVVAVYAAEHHLALLVGAARPRLPPHAGERRRRKWEQGLAVALGELELGHAEAVVALAGEVEAVLEQALVELHDVVEARYGDEQGAAMGAHHVLAVALLVSGAGVGEAVVETAVGGEELEHLADADLGAEAAADLRGIVEDRAHGNAADGLEHVAQALAHALRGFAPEDLREADARMGGG
jgi:hypothetical protein